MKKNNNIDKLVSKVLKETLEEKAEKLTSKIKSNVNELGGMDDQHPVFGNMNISKMSSKEVRDLMNKHYNKGKDYDDEDIEMDDMDIEGMYDDSVEMDEGFDSLEVKNFRRKKDYDPEEFEEIPLDGGNDHSNLEDDSVTPPRYLYNQLKRRFKDLEGDEELSEGETNVCECGGMMKEGECSECGYKMEGIYDVDDIDDKENEFDYVQEEEDFEDENMEVSSNDETCKYHMDNFGPDDERTIMSCKGIKESLKGRQKVLDKNKNNKIDSEDFKLLRKGKKSETKEGKKFPDLSGDGKVTRKDILLGRGVKLKNNKTKVKESISLTEDEMIDLIENIVKEQKTKLRSVGKPRGLETYEKAHKGSGKENEDYLKSVTKKMKDYLKDGSKGEYSESPKHFPKGNGELAKMSKKAYEISKDGTDFLDNYMRPGMENLDYDEIHPNEDWMKDNIEGSSKTGNNPEWANAEQTELGKKINNKRKENKFAKAKRAAYNKSPQPVVTDKPGQESGKGLDIKVESTEPKNVKKLNEEFEKMKSLISYDRKTQ